MMREDENGDALENALNQIVFCLNISSQKFDRPARKAFYTPGIMIFLFDRQLTEFIFRTFVTVALAEINFEV